MESLQDTKLRLGAVRNVGKITRAMEVVAATKMRKAQELALSSRPYAFKVLDLLQKLSHEAPVKTSLQEVRPVKKTLVVVVASDKGLTGSFNAQVLRASDKFFESESKPEADGHVFEMVAIGKKAELYAKKKKIKLVKSFFGAGDYAAPEDSSEAADFVMDYFAKGLCDRVVVLSMHFRTALRQDVILRQVLPAGVLEANASEHSARRVAMKTASDNADDLAGSLMLKYNTARQAGITKEIIEITSTKK